MFRWFTTLFLIPMVFMTTCTANIPTAQNLVSSSEEHAEQAGPPAIEISTFEPPHKNIQTIKHIYCWDSEACPEYKFLPKVEDVPLTKVDPGQLVKIRFPNDPKPTSIQVFVKSISQRIYATDEVAFSAPTQPGTYFYSVMVTWKRGNKTGVVEYFFRLQI